MKRYSNMMQRLNDTKLDSKRDTLLVLAVAGFCTIWLTLEFFTKLADSL